VSDVNTSPQGVDENEDFYDEAQETFPGKEDLKDRLVAVFALENGTDVNKEGKRYPIVKTVTCVLDDGPDGYQTRVIRDEQMTENRVPSIAAEGMQEIDLRWSTEGMVSRLAPRVGKTWMPLVGRINSRPNKVKGRSPSWSISTPTDEDKDYIRSNGFNPKLRAIAARLEAEAKKAEDTAAFDV
jgi:hypothetical protein